MQTALSPLLPAAVPARGRRRIRAEGEAVLYPPIRLARVARSVLNPARGAAACLAESRRDPGSPALRARRSRAVARALGAMALASLGMAMGGRAVAGSFGLGLQMGTSFYQHTSSETSPLDFQGRSLEPVVRFDRDNGRSRLMLEARRRFDLYSGSSLPEPLGGGSQTSDHASVLFRQMWSQQNRLDADGSFLRTRDVLDIDRSTLALQSDVAEWASNVSANVGRLEAEYHGRGWSYADPLLDDAVAHSWNARFIPVRQASSAWFLSVHERELDVAGQTALSSRVAAIGLRHSVGQGMSAQVEAGGSRVSYADGGRGSGAEAAFSMTGPTDAILAISAQLQVETAFPTTFLSTVSTRVANGRVWLTARSLVDGMGGFYRYPTFSRGVGLGVSDTLSRAMVIGLEANRANQRAFHVYAPTADVFETSAWLERRMRPWLTGRLGCAYLSQNGDGSTSARPFQRMRVDATLTMLSW